MDDIQTGRRNRLKAIQKALNISQKAFAKRLNTNPAFISQLLNGHRNVTEAFAYEISKCFTWINPDWLITGNGNMDIKENTDPNPDILQEHVKGYGQQTFAAEPFEALSRILASHESRIKKLEHELAEIKSKLKP